MSRFLYKQCSDYATSARSGTPNQTIFNDSYSPAGKLEVILIYLLTETSLFRLFQVKQRYSFHLYINTAPCGDGRTFTLSEPTGSQGIQTPSPHEGLRAVN